MDEKEQGRSRSTQALMRGLRILGILVDKARPMSATEIAEESGLHQSSVSRILATLSDGGYVRKESYRSFVPDYGILALANTARSQFSITETPREALQGAVDKLPGFTAVLAMLWRDQLLYFLRSSAGQHQVIFEGHGYPLHISAPALRIIADMPDDEGLQLLARSRERYGWPLPDPHFPKDEKQAIAMARRLIAHDCLIDDEWTVKDYVAAAIPIEPLDGHPIALVIYGPRSQADDDTLRLLLHTTRREVESALKEKPVAVTPSVFPLPN